MAMGRKTGNLKLEYSRYTVGYCMVSHHTNEDSCSVVYSFRMMLGKREWEDPRLKTELVLVVCFFSCLKFQYLEILCPDCSTQDLAIISRQDFLGVP